jgi:hypothetical protein
MCLNLRPSLCVRQYLCPNPGPMLCQHLRSSPCQRLGRRFALLKRSQRMRRQKFDLVLMALEDLLQHRLLKCPFFQRQPKFLLRRQLSRQFLRLLPAEVLELQSADKACRSSFRCVERRRIHRVSRRMHRFHQRDLFPCPEPGCSGFTSSFFTSTAVSEDAGVADAEGAGESSAKRAALANCFLRVLPATL